MSCSRPLHVRRCTSVRANRRPSPIRRRPLRDRVVGAARQRPKPILVSGSSWLSSRPAAPREPRSDPGPPTERATRADRAASRACGESQPAHLIQTPRPDVPKVREPARGPPRFDPPAQRAKSRESEASFDHRPRLSEPMSDATAQPAEVRPATNPDQHGPNSTSPTSHGCPAEALPSYGLNGHGPNRQDRHAKTRAALTRTATTPASHERGQPRLGQPQPGCVARQGQQPQAPPQQPPPPPPPAGMGGGLPPRPVTATVERSLTVSEWPCGHAVGTAASRIGRLTSKVSPQARHR